MLHQVLARQWRPHQFSEVIGQTHAVQALSHALDQNRLHHAYLFTGTRGVGKTTLARIIAKALNCEKGISSTPCGQCENCIEIDAGRFPDLYEIDAASRTKVEDTRDLLDNVQYSPVKGRFKIYLIDEVHMLSGHSFNALLKTLEEPPAHVKFLLATTEAQKLPATVLSRCLQFHLLQMLPKPIADHLAHILTQEKIPFETEALHLIGKAADGSMRDALSLLDQAIAFGNGEVSSSSVKSMLGTLDDQIIIDIISALANQDGSTLLRHSAHLNEQGASYSRALAELLNLLHQIALLQVVPDYDDEGMNASIHDLAKRISREDTQLYYQIALIGQKDIQNAPSPRCGFEMTLLRMLAFAPVASAISAPARTVSSAAKPAQVTPKPEAQPAEAIKPRAPEIQSNQSTSAPSPQLSATPSAWQEIFNQLDLTGAARAMAELCQLKSLNNDHLRLSLAPKHEPLLQQKHTKRIEEALQQLLNKPMTVSIDVEPSDSNATPAGRAEQERRSQKQHAEETLLADSAVQRLMQTFDATLIKESITPVEG
jgi:DNA polymerase-3 subunit gamma/tau